MTTKTDEQERWYFLGRDGIATLCANAEDARDSASEADQLYPKNAPHVVAQIAPVAARAAPQSQNREGWKEAAIAWEVCASIHRNYCKGKDPFFKTRQADFVKHAEDSREKAIGPCRAEDKTDALQSQDREDSARLDWVEKNARRDPDMGGNHTWWPTSFNKTIRGPSLRDAIDQARRVDRPVIGPHGQVLVDQGTGANRAVIGPYGQVISSRVEGEGE